VQSGRRRRLKNQVLEIVDCVIEPTQHGRLSIDSAVHHALKEQGGIRMILVASQLIAMTAVLNMHRMGDSPPPEHPAPGHWDPQNHAKSKKYSCT
jgi:hypothetical protein